MQQIHKFAYISSNIHEQIHKFPVTSINNSINFQQHPLNKKT